MIRRHKGTPPDSDLRLVIFMRDTQKLTFVAIGNLLSIPAHKVHSWYVTGRVLGASDAVQAVHHQTGG